MHVLIHNEVCGCLWWPWGAMDGPGRVEKLERPDSLGIGCDNGKFLEAEECGHQIGGAEKR